MDAVVYDNVPPHRSVLPGVDKRTLQPQQRSRRPRRGGSRWRLALLVTAQNLLVALCLAVTLYVHWNAPQHMTQESNKHEIRYIRFEPIDPVTTNLELKPDTQYNNKIVVNNDQININCTGPYILYMNVCYQGGGGGTGSLSLQVNGTNRSVLPLPAPTKELKCTGLHSVVYLSRDENATLHFNSTNIDIKNIGTLGLTYLLGSQCYF